MSDVTIIMTFNMAATGTTQMKTESECALIKVTIVVAIAFMTRMR